MTFRELVPGMELERQWDYLLVMLSYGLSVFGAWTAFAMVEQGKLALLKGRRPTLWSVSAGLALGGWYDSTSWRAATQPVLTVLALPAAASLQCMLCQCSLSAFNVSLLTSTDDSGTMALRLPVTASVLSAIVFVVLGFVISMKGFEKRTKHELHRDHILQEEEGIKNLSPYVGFPRTWWEDTKNSWSIDLPNFMQGMSDRYILAGAVLSGIGISAMLYLSMLALEFPGRIVFNIGVVVASCVIASVASAIALSMLFYLKTSTMQIFSSLVMGAAISGAHYTGVHVSFIYDPTVEVPDEFVSTTELGIAVTCTVIVSCFFLQNLGSTQIKNAKTQLDTIVQEARAELSLTIQEVRRLRDALDLQQDMNVLINTLRPTLFETRNIDQFIRVIIAITGRNYDPSTVSTSAMDGDKRESLRKLIAHPVACELLKDQLTSASKGENLLFYLAVELYNNIMPSDRHSLLALSSQITKRFIDTDSDRQINISNKMRNRIHHRLSKPTSDLFNEAQEESFRLMIDNDFSAFLQSREGKLAMWLTRSMNEENIMNTIEEETNTIVQIDEPEML